MRRLALGFLAVSAVVLLRLMAIEAHAADRNNAAVLLRDGILRVLVLGDSIAAGSGDETGYGIAGRLRQELNSPTVEVANGGIPGARIHDVLQAMRSRKDQVRKSDVIVLSIGGNDLYGSPRERTVALLSPHLRMSYVAKRVRVLVHDLQQINPAASIILLGLYNPYARTDLGPMLSVHVRRWEGNLSLTFAEDRSVTVLPIADLLASAQRLSPRDKFHPGAIGYAAIAARIAGSAIFASVPPAPTD